MKSNEYTITKIPHKLVFPQIAGEGWESWQSALFAWAVYVDVKERQSVISCDPSHLCQRSL